MPDKGTRARDSITKTARRLFYHKGYAATSYADIADVTGYGKGNIHYYFKSKDDILHAVTEARLQDYRAILAGWEQDCATPYACLEKFIDMFAGNAENLSAYGCPMGTLNGELGKDAAHLQQDTRRMFDMYLNWVQRQFGRFMAEDAAKDHAEHLMVLAQGVSVVAHAYRDAGLVRRQTDMARRWLARVCDGKGMLE